MVNRLQSRAAFAITFALIAGMALTLDGCAKKRAETAAREQAATERTAQIAVLEARVDRIKDANDIKRLQRAYGFYLDKAQWDQMADLFTANASVEYANEGVYVGQNRIREYLKKLGGGHNGLVEGQLNNHLILQPVVHVAPDGRSAKGRWRALIQTGQYKKSANWGEGTYENEYVKEDGVWKISKLHWYVSFVAPYEGGWAKMKPVDAFIGEAAKQLEPDQRPSVEYKPYPAAFVPPYHYPNPVAGDGAGATGSEASTASGSAPADEQSGAMRVDTPVAANNDLVAWKREVSRLESHDAIENLQGAYGYYFDKNQWDDIANLFTDDATYEIGQRGVYKGKDHIRKALDLIGPAGAQPGVLNNEMQLQPIIHVSADGRSAKARWRTLEMKGVHGKSGAWGEGVYENEYRLDRGKWKISKLHYYLTFRADYDKGWSKGTLPIEQPDESLPADAPPTEVFGALPDVYLPPYHYAHLGSHPQPRPDLGTPPTDLASLAKKVSLLNDEIEVQDLQRAYGYYVDKNMWDEVTALFADDGELEIGGRGVFVGRKRVNEYMHFLGKPGPQRGWLFDHSQWQPITHVADDGKTAKQRLRAFVMGGTQGTGEAVPAFAVWGECTYENEYVKVNGSWKMARLYGFFNMYSPYTEGWGKVGMPNTKPEKKLPPDRPPTVVYETYPALQLLPYHYANPVTGK